MRAGFPRTLPALIKARLHEFSGHSRSCPGSPNALARLPLRGSQALVTLRLSRRHGLRMPIGAFSTSRSLQGLLRATAHPRSGGQSRAPLVVHSASATRRGSGVQNARAGAWIAAEGRLGQEDSCNGGEEKLRVRLASVAEIVRRGRDFRPGRDCRSRGSVVCEVRRYEQYTNASMGRLPADPEPSVVQAALARQPPLR